MYKILVGTNLSQTLVVTSPHRPYANLRPCLLGSGLPSRDHVQTVCGVRGLQRYRESRVSPAGREGLQSGCAVQEPGRSAGHRHIAERRSVPTLS